MHISLEEIRHLDIFDRLSLPTLELVAEIAELLVFDRHTVFYRQGEPLPGVFCLISGQAKLYRQVGSKIQILVLAQPGDAFGTEILVTGTPTACNATATVNGKALYLPADRLRHLLPLNAELVLVFLELLSNQFLTMSNLVHDLVFHDVSARLALFLLRQELYQSLEGYCIARNFSQQELAAVVGTGREVVCRTLKRFEGEGILRVIPRRIIILDLPRLIEIANLESGS